MSSLGIKSWRENVPSCAAARPGVCPCCRAPARPIGGRLSIVGHGLVARQVRGPVTSAGAAEDGLVVMRRYRCRTCRAVLVVGPRGLARRRWYGASAIALALAVYAAGATSAAARKRVSPARVLGTSAVDRWVTLIRWVEASRSGDLFSVGGLEAAPRHRVAELVVLALAARAGHRFGDDLAESAFTGATIAA